MGVRARTVTFAIKQDVTEKVEQYAKYAWILHDKDVNSENGELKEAHYHYYLEFGNARYLSGIAKEFDIPENMIEVVHNKAGILRYFTHSTEASKEKYEYDISDLHSSFDIEQVTMTLDYVGYYSIIKNANTPEEAVRKCQAAGISGSPYVVVNYIVNTWEKIHSLD